MSVFDLGSSLRDARERRRLTFAEMEQVTKVRAKYLRALEEDDFAALPGATYVKGFLRAYAEALGLDGQLYVDEYNSRFVTGAEERFIRPRRMEPPREVRWIERHAVVLALAAIALITVVVVGAWRFAPGSGSPQAPAVAAPARVPAASQAPLTRLVLRARGTTWIEVRNTSPVGRLLFQGTVRRSEVQRFTAARLWLNVGTPARLTATVNGRAVRLPGATTPKVMVATASGVVALVTG